MALVIEMEGGPRERGLAYGETARPLIAEAAERWQQDAGADAAALEHALVHANGFRAAARRWAPALVDEVDAIAVGSGIDGDRIWALNLLDEGWWMRHSDQVSSACSGFAVSPAGSGRTLLAQNMDLPTWVDGLLVLLDIGPGGDAVRVLAPAYAGIVATNACNSAGLGLCVNSLGQLPTSSSGLPVAFVIRLLAEQRS